MGLGGLALLVGAAAVGLRAGDSRKGAGLSRASVGMLVCDRETFDFGVVTLKEAAGTEHRFILTNTSDHPISLVRQTSTCRCTVAELPQDPIPPGGRMELPVKTNWSGLPGRQSAMVTLHTDDPNRPALRLVVTALVKVPAVLSPSVVNFGLLKPGEVARRVVELREGSDPRRFRVTAVENPSKFLTVTRLSPSGEETSGSALEGGLGKFAIRITAPRTSGREQARVVFRTDLEDTPELPLVVTAVFAGALLATPPTLLFPGPSETVPKAREVCIRSTVLPGKLDPKVEIVWNGDEVNPFFVQEVTVPLDSPEGAASVFVGFNGKEVKRAFCQAILRVTVGSDCVEIPLVALGAP